MTAPHVRRYDEEPDFDAPEVIDHLVEFEGAIAAGHCGRCGIRGHLGRDCPTVTPDLLKHQWGDQ